MDTAAHETILRDLAAARARTDGLLRRADPLAWVNEGTGRRVIDVAAHVAQWEAHAAASLEAFAAGGEFRLPPPFEIHAINQRIFEEHRGRRPEEVLAFLAASRGRLLAAAGRIPPERRAGPVTYPWGARGGVDELLLDMRRHDEHHAAQVRAAALPVAIERCGPDRWERVRGIRLRALADSPDAFGTTLAEDGARPPETWRARLADPARATFVADADGEDAGLAVGGPFEGRDGAAGLFGMWVAPGFRGRGIGDALVEAVVAWARAAGYRRVLLDVGDGNAPAIRLYARCGFRPTGNVGSLPPPREHVREHEREKTI